MTTHLPPSILCAVAAARASDTGVFTELVARHGSRGPSGVKLAAALNNIWHKASADGAPTPPGAPPG